MKKYLYAVFDECSGEFGSPVVYNNDAIAKRDFVQSCKDPKVAYLAADWKLYQIAEYDTESGIIDSAVQFICAGVPEVDHE